jgi:hypothetical protein
VLALEFADPDAYRSVDEGDVMVIEGVRDAMTSGADIQIKNLTRGEGFVARHRLSARQVALLLAGGLIPWLRDQARRAV